MKAFFELETWKPFFHLMLHHHQHLSSNNNISGNNNNSNISSYAFFQPSKAIVLKITSFSLMASSSSFQPFSWPRDCLTQMDYATNSFQPLKPLDNVSFYSHQFAKCLNSCYLRTFMFFKQVLLLKYWFSRWGGYEKRRLRSDMKFICLRMPGQNWHADSLYRIKGRWIRLPDPLLPSK